MNKNARGKNLLRVRKKMEYGELLSSFYGFVMLYFLQGKRNKLDFKRWFKSRRVFLLSSCFRDERYMFFSHARVKEEFVVKKNVVPAGS